MSSANDSLDTAFLEEEEKVDSSLRQQLTKKLKNLITSQIKKSHSAVPGKLAKRRVNKIQMDIEKMYSHHKCASSSHQVNFNSDKFAISGDILLTYV